MDKANIAGKQPILHEAKEGIVYAWCSCGRSENQPFCNGAHRGTEFSPNVVKESEDKSVYLCTCKQTANPPYCDGSHTKL